MLLASRSAITVGLAAIGSLNIWRLAVKLRIYWFLCVKLHLVVNEQGELLNLQITPGNLDDRKPVAHLLKFLFGKVFADRGYVSQSLAAQLRQDLGIEFFAKPRRNMKNCLMHLNDKLLSRKRSIIETIIDQLKNISLSRAFSPSKPC